MLRGHPKLSADMIFAQLPQKGLVPIGQKIIKSDAGPDKNLLHPGQSAQLSKQSDIIRMIRLQIGAGLWVKALPVGADPLRQLPVAGRASEVGSGTSYIMDVPLKSGISGHSLSLPQKRFVASGLDDPTLMEGQSAEAAASEASSVAGQGEQDLRDGRDASLRLIGGVIIVHIGQFIDIIQFLGRQRPGGGILYHIPFLPIFFHQGSCREKVGVLILDQKAPGVFQLICRKGVKVRKQDTVSLLQHVRHILSLVHRSGNIGDILRCDAAVQCIRHLHDGQFAHAVQQKICSGIHENGMLESVGPVVIMCQSAQAGLNASDHDGDLLIFSADQIAVHNGGIVRSPPGFPAGGVCIEASSFLIHRKMIHHGIHIAGAHQKTKSWFPKHGNTLLVRPVRLRDDAHLIASGL